MSVVPMRKSKTAEPKVPAKPYEPTEREAAMLASLEKRKQSARCAPVLKATNIPGEDGELPRSEINVDHPGGHVAHDLIMESLALTEYPMLAGLMKDMAGLAQKGAETDVHTMNYALTIARGIGPQDPTEALLATQMAAVHMTTMRFANYIAASNDSAAGFQRKEAFERSMNRLARTFAAQMEALKRYRSKGEQRVYVERVNVEQGGQAIVGLVDRGGGDG